MEITFSTILISMAGIVIMGLLAGLQFIAVLKPRSKWVIENVYGGNPELTDPKAYFAFNQGYAWADAIFWGPIQITGSIGMLLGQRWGFLLALIGSVPFWYTAITIFVWDKALAIQKPTFNYWVIIWGIWPVFGVIEMIFCFVRLIE